jgi:hypothetical protein
MYLVVLLVRSKCFNEGLINKRAFSSSPAILISRALVWWKMRADLCPLLIPQKVLWCQLFCQKENDPQRRGASIATRVTRLGEFSPFVWLLTLWSFLTIIEVAQIFVIFAKDGLGLYFWAIFFHKLVWSPWLPQSLRKTKYLARQIRFCLKERKKKNPFRARN